MEKQISPKEASEKIKNGAILLDVREKEEIDFTSVEPKKWIPMGALNKRMHELPKDKEILCLCRSGGRSAKATSFLIHNGFDAKNIKGGILEWHKEVDPKIKPYVIIQFGEGIKISELKEQQ